MQNITRFTLDTKWIFEEFVVCKATEYEKRERKLVKGPSSVRWNKPESLLKILRTSGDRQ